MIGGVRVSCDIGSTHAPMAAASLVTFLKDVGGSSLAEILLARDADPATSWVARQGSDMVPSANHMTKVFGAYGAGLYPSTVTTTQSIALVNATQYKSIWAVFEGSPPAHAYDWIADNASSDVGAIARDGISSNWYTAGGWSHYVDGTTSETVPVSGLHVVEGVTTNTINGGLRYGHISLAIAWPTPVHALLGWTTIPTADQRAAIVPRLLSFRGY